MNGEPTEETTGEVVTAAERAALVDGVMDQHSQALELVADAIAIVERRRRVDRGMILLVAFVAFVAVRLAAEAD